MFGVYSIQDIKADFTIPQIYKNDELAIRAVKSTVNDQSTILNQYPSDFKFYKIGEFDSETGVIEGYPVPVFICDINSLVIKGDVTDA